MTELQKEFEATGYTSWINADLYPDGKIYTQEYTEWLERQVTELRKCNVSGALPIESMQNRIAKAADKFLVDNNTTPHIDHWSFRMGARWMENEIIGGNDR